MTHCPHCGCDLPTTGGAGDGQRTRSNPQLRRFFSVIKAAFHHWPESHDFRPESPEHLRKFLLCGAGYSEHTDIPVEWAEDQPGVTKLTALAIEAAIRAADGYAFVRPAKHGGRVRVYKAKSIAYHKLSHADACRLFADIDLIIKAELGVEPDELLKQTEMAA